MRRPLLFLSAVLLALGLSACGSEGAEESEVATWETTRGDLKITLTESGTLEARNKVNVRLNADVQAKILSIVDEGSLVNVGDVLIELDKDPVLKEIERLEDRLIQLDASLKNAESDLGIQKDTNASDIEAATLKLEFAIMELERYKDGDHPKERRNLELRLKQAKDRYEKIPDLLEEGFVTEIEAEEKELDLTNAEKDLELYEKYTYPMTMRQRQADVAEAKASLGRVKSKADARVEARTADFLQAQRQHEAALAKHEEQNEILGKLTILAPQEGIVIYGGRRDRWGNMENQVKVGETAYPRRTLIELPDLSRMNVTLQVHQADVTKLEKGQVAWVTIPGRRTAAMRGTVTDIGSIAQSTSWRDPVRRFNVTVQIDERVNGLRAGVTVQCIIDVGGLTNVMYVPLQTVASSGGSYFVYVRESGEARRRPVQLGLSNEQFVEVTEGLVDGELVLLVNPDVIADEEEGDQRSRKERPKDAGGNGKKDGSSGSGRGKGSGRPASSGH